MSNENTRKSPEQRGRRRNRRRPEKTMEWYHDSTVGPEGDLQGLTVARFYVSIAEDETPEVFFIPMTREEVSQANGSTALRSSYSGDIEKNAIPLSMLDIDSLYSALVTMKARMLRGQAEYHARAAGERPSRPSEARPAPMTHRIKVPDEVVKAIPPAPTTSLADALSGWGDALKGWDSLADALSGGD